VFQSELVVKEFDSIMGELRQLSMMAARFPDFDLQGKEMFLDKVRRRLQQQQQQQQQQCRTGRGVGMGLLGQQEWLGNVRRG
jgi:hypothetical protein